MYIRCYGFISKNENPIVLFFNMHTRKFTLPAGQHYIRNGCKAVTEYLPEVSRLTLTREEFHGKVLIKVKANGFYTGSNDCKIRKGMNIFCSRLPETELIMWVNKYIDASEVVDSAPKELSGSKEKTECTEEKSDDTEGTKADKDDKEKDTGVEHTESSESKPSSNSTIYASPLSSLYGEKETPKAESDADASYRATMNGLQKFEDMSVKERDLNAMRQRVFDLQTEYTRLKDIAQREHEAQYLQAKIEDLEDRVNKLKNMILTHNYEGTDWFSINK